MQSSYMQLSKNVHLLTNCKAIDHKERMSGGLGYTQKGVNYTATLYAYLRTCTYVYNMYVHVCMLGLLSVTCGLGILPNWLGLQGLSV